MPSPIPLRTHGKYGAMDQTGLLVIEPQFDYLREFCEGMAFFQKDGKCGFINTLGEIVIAPIFDVPACEGGHLGFSEGLAVVRVGGKEGYIDHSGSFMIKPRFDIAGPFSDQKAFVEDCQEHVIDRSGA